MYAMNGNAAKARSSSTKREMIRSGIPLENTRSFYNDAGLAEIVKLAGNARII